MTINPIWNRNSFAPVSARKFRLIVPAHSGKLAKVDRLELLPGGPVLNDWQSTTKGTDDSPAIAEFASDSPVTVSELTWSSDGVTGSREGQPTVYRIEAVGADGAWKLVCSSLDHVGRSEVALPIVTDDELLGQLHAQDRTRRARLIAQRAAIEAELTAIPEPQKIYSAKPREVETSYLLERGSVSRRGEEVNPGALTAVGQLDSDFRLPPGADDGKRRLALADWVTDPKNPLTARVIVNRVWYSHFGAGIVNTPSDFGLNGDRPSHPELLDWLAASFVENGWSLKWLHRTILSSRTYKQSSRFNPKAYSVDAGNRLLWRMPLKRMDAETLRDAVLFSSGKLDTARRGGPGFLLQKNAGGGSYIYKALNNDGPAVWRRAVYRHVVRGGERIFLDSFDCPDPSVATPQRSISNTAVQALTLLNNDFVLRQAGFLAEHIEREAGKQTSAQIDSAYRILFQRTPSSPERELGLAFVPEHGLPLYVRVLLNSNEYVYVP
jgi:hypothetical protein